MERGGVHTPLYNLNPNHLSPVLLVRFILLRQEWKGTGKDKRSNERNAGQEKEFISVLGLY